MPFVHAHEGTQLRVLGDLVSIKVPSARSLHRLAAVTVQVPPSSFVPVCRHRIEEECYFVIEGELTVMLDAEERVLKAGDMAHIPPGTPHGYRNASAAPARLLAFSVGGPIDQFFIELSEKVQAMPRDAAAMHALMQLYGIEPAAARRTDHAG